MYRCFVTISSQGASPETIVSRGVPNKSECNQGNLPADCNNRHNSGVLMAIFSYCICNHLLLDLANIKPRAFVCALTMGGTVTGHSIGRRCAGWVQRLFDATQLLWQTADFKPDPFFQICLKFQNCITFMFFNQIFKTLILDQVFLLFWWFDCHGIF